MLLDGKATCSMTWQGTDAKRLSFNGWKEATLVSLHAWEKMQMCCPLNGWESRLNLFVLNGWTQIGYTCSIKWVEEEANALFTNWAEKSAKLVFMERAEPKEATCCSYMLVEQKKAKRCSFNG